jgi:hypothetical protein
VNVTEKVVPPMMTPAELITLNVLVPDVNPQAAVLFEPL